MKIEDNNKFLDDLWEININGVSVWPYFRFDYNSARAIDYKTRFNIGIADFIGFLKFIFLFANKADCVVFIAAREELLTLVQSEYFAKYEKVLIFKREENHNIRGNVILIEAIRYFFRALSPFIFYFTYHKLVNTLINNKLNPKKLKRNAKAAVGDYFYNKLLKLIIGRKKIYFSNCVIPKIERTQRLHDSIEIQHGVIHNQHPCYAYIPPKYFRIPILAWGAFWAKKIPEYGFGGNVICGPIPSHVNTYDKRKKSICFFTTVDIELSSLVMQCAESITDYPIYIQKHPRDTFDYNIVKSENVNFCMGTKPSDHLISVMHDSTLVYFAFLHKIKCIYMAKKSENKEEIIKRLKEKYDVAYSRDYQIVYTVNQLDQEIKNFPQC